MKNRIFKAIGAVMLVSAMLLGSAVGVSVTAEEEDTRMAYNIYSNPQFGSIPNAFETFSIDMYVTESAPYTYWSLANFNMHISEQTKKEYRDIRDGGAYAGMQTRGEGDDRTAILSFWEWHYWPNGYDKNVTETNLNVERIYPAGAQSDFGGEGEGTNWITSFDWSDNQWYRMVLHTWDDPIRGTTYCGQWIADLKSGKWTLISYFDTKMKNSYLEGSMSFFMENYIHVTADMERDVRLKNIYVKQYESGLWSSVNTTKLSHCNDWANNKKGKHSFGATEEYFWARSGGPLDAGMTQAEHDAAWKPQNFTINQPSTPTFGEPSIQQIKVYKTADGWDIGWTHSDTSTPQLQYELTVTDKQGKVLCTETAVRPESLSAAIGELETDAFKCELTVTDIFGSTTTAYGFSDKYDAQMTEDIGFAGHQEGYNALRFVCYTDNLDYESIDMQISVLNVQGKKFNYPTTTVFKTLCGNVNGVTKPVVSCLDEVDCTWHVPHDYLYGMSIEKIPAGTYEYHILPVATKTDGQVVYGKEAVLTITVKDPPVEKMIEELTQYQSFRWYNVNIMSADAKYNVNNLTTATASPVEVWDNHLQMLMTLNKNELDASSGVGTDQYEYRFDLYYRPNNGKDYKCVTIKPWSVYPNDDRIYRCTFYSAGMNDMVEGTEYDCIIVFKKQDTRLGYAKSSFVWTDSAQCFLDYALTHNEVIK